jgi:hypothetical protein
MNLPSQQSDHLNSSTTQFQIQRSLLDKDRRMEKVNLVLQGKSGVGKSLVAALLAQHYQVATETEVVCIDTDPVNATLTGYSAFKTRRLELMRGAKVDERKFDTMMEWVLQEDANFVIDNGASCFLPLSNYLIENDAISMISQAGKEVVIHTVVTGAQALLDTLTGFDQLAAQMLKEAQIMVWLNEYFGEIKHDGKSFEEMQVYETHKNRIAGILRIPKQSSDTFGRDIEIMLHKKLTFAEARASQEFSLMAKQRLAMMQRTIFEQLQPIFRTSQT